MKKCPRCGEVKNLRAFAKFKYTKDGLQTYCRKCSADMHKEDYQFYKEKKICVFCRQNNAMIGAVLCPECADKKAVYDKKRYKKKSIDVEYVECLRRRRREQYRQRVNAGICGRCGKHHTEEGHSLCYECLILIRKNNRKKRLNIPRSARPSFGLCYICGEPVLFGQNLCQKHYEIRIQTLKPNASPHDYWHKTKDLFFTGGKNDQKRN